SMTRPPAGAAAPSHTSFTRSPSTGISTFFRALPLSGSTSAPQRTYWTTAASGFFTSCPAAQETSAAAANARTRFFMIHLLSKLVMLSEEAAVGPSMLPKLPRHNPAYCHVERPREQSNATRQQVETSPTSILHHAASGSSTQKAPGL